MERISSAYISNEFRAALEVELINLGGAAGIVTVIAKPIPEQKKDTVDPQEILVGFPSLFDQVEYLPEV